MVNQYARDLRKNLTDAERRLWSRLRLRQIGGQKFRRQHPIGPYIVDFVCLEHRLIVEVDGSQHLDGADAERDAWLVSQGCKVLRFWDNQVLTETVAVAEAIAQAVSAEEGPPS